MERFLGLSYTNRARYDPSERCAHVKSTSVQFRQPCPVMNDETNKALFVCSGAKVIIANHLFQQKRKRRRRRSELLGVMKSQQISDQYKNFIRTSPTTFKDLLIKIVSEICKKEPHLRRELSIQLVVTVRFLATEDSYSSLQYLSRMSKQAIAKITPEVCAALVETLKENIKLTRAYNAGRKTRTMTAECQWKFATGKSSDVVRCLFLSGSWMRKWVRSCSANVSCHVFVVQTRFYPLAESVALYAKNVTSFWRLSKHKMTSLRHPQELCSLCRRLPGECV
ncbi:hypothetical protein PR048_015877 [Dryococelus australis]|uniref:Uncharacterized protein n=1 Tax=Dryococelus australis TaxID=614101 RepID=A0ABQ9HIH5_9NEOP|nr:hypothetical protein PR048_015877 [Dryococelus australis]